MACSGASGSPSGAGSVSTMASNSGRQVGVGGGHADAGERSTLAGDGRDDRELDAFVVGVEVEEELVDLVEHLFGPGVLAVDLVEHDHRRQAGGQRLGQHVAGLGQRPFGRVDEQQHAVDQGQRPLDLAAEVGVARRVDQVDADVAPLHRGRLGEDGDAALALLVVGVHDPVDQGLVGVEDVGRPQHGVDEGGLAVVDVRDEREITKGGRLRGARGGGGVRRERDRRHCPRACTRTRGRDRALPRIRGRALRHDGRGSHRSRGRSCA